MNQKKIIKQQKVSDSDKENFYHSKKFHYLILLSGTILLYGWTYTFKYSLDDELVVNYIYKFDNNFDALSQIFHRWYGTSDYRPVTIASFWLERFLFNDIHASTSHLINVFLFALLLLCIYRFIVLCNFFEDKKKLYTLAFLTCLFFLVHPNHVSVVANIKSRDNLLSMLFGILACSELIIAYDLKQYWRVLTFLILISIALLSKLDAYVFILIPGLLFSIYRKLPLKKIALVFIVTMVLVSISFQIRSFFMSGLNQSQFSNAVVSDAGNPLLGNETFINRLSLAFTSLFYYLKFLFLPFGYYFYYGSRQIELSSLFSIFNTLAFLSTISLLALSIYYYKKNKIYLFSLLFFLLSISYALNFFITVSGIVMDRYNFIASLGFCIGVAALFLDFSDKKNTPVLRNKILFIVLLTWAGFTIYRTSAWQSYFTLFNRDLPYLTKSINGNRIAAGTYINFALEEQESKKNYNKSYTDSLILLAEKQLYVAMKISDKSSRIWEHLGICALYKNNDSSALNMLRKSYILDSTNLNGTNYLGFAFWRLNQLDSAEHYFNYVINRESEFGYSANNLINMYVRNNQKAKADSLIIVLQQRYPGDKKLYNKIIELSN